MRTAFALRPIARLFVTTSIIRALVLPLPAQALAERPLEAPLADGYRPSSTGRVLRDRPDGVTLASVRGTALVNPATPVTRRGEWRTSRAAVHPGTIMRILVTGYSSTVDQTDDTPFTTASGTRVHDGTVAMNFLPFGTKVRFPDEWGSKIFIVEDRHHPRLSDRADVWFPTRRAAIEFGVRVLRMKIVG